MTQSTDFLTHLNPSQRRAVEHFCGPLLVVAGAGSGKTRALTYRIANLILTHKVDPENILAVTFTNKAAREMKSRIETLFAQQLAVQTRGQRLELLPELEQTQLRSRVYKKYIKPLWIGTFHSLFARILRYDINKYTDEKGRQWKRNFSIFDESDAQTLVKTIVTKQLNLDDKKFNPRTIRYAISNAKNLGLSPQAFEKEQSGYKGRLYAEVYHHYQDQLAANNALDFDDLILVPVKLFQQNESVLGYWHNQFRHILVDEYQDTNRIQYELIHLLTTNGEPEKTQWDWRDRSVFVVGDADQCFPPGTKVLTPVGEKAIETLNVGDQVLSPTGQKQLYPHQITHIKKGYFCGTLWSIRAGEQVLRGTPHHIVLARMTPIEGHYYVYLMYRADRGYRIGITKSLRHNDYRCDELGFKVRIAQENGDKLWVLKTTTSYEEAAYYEAYYAAKYGLPTLVFHGKGRQMRLNDEWIFRLYQEIDTITNAHRLMQDLWLHPDFPHYRPQNGLRRQTLNLVMFGTPRLDNKKSASYHRIQWCSNRRDIATNLEAAGFSIRSGKNSRGYRVETARVSYKEAVSMAHSIADAGQLEIQRKALISGTSYYFMPLSHLHPGMKVLVEVDDTLTEVEIEQVWQDEYEGDVYDLEVDVAHTYIANRMLVHNSIYSFRMADFTILLGFQQDFGDGLSDETTRTMVKLEENYRSRENILQAANYLIEQNTQRIDKILRPTRGFGEVIYCHHAEDELEEAHFVVQQILKLNQQNPELDWGSFAILYRTNAQSRPLEDALRGRVPYVIIGGLKFYDRKEVKDALAYLRTIANPSDTVSLLRIINTPRRGIGKATIDNLVLAAQELGTPLWEIIQDETSVNTIAGRSAKAVNRFAQLIKQCQENTENLEAVEIIKFIMEESGYTDDLKNQGTDEAENRLANIHELYNAVVQFQEENEDSSLEGFLANASLASDLDNLEDGQQAVSLMTLHSAKGLEFPVVFLVGLEQGLFPHNRTIDDPIALEEERRLCYVGITRAQEQLFLAHARERRLYGYREPAVRSQFLDELPEDLISSTLVKVKQQTPSASTEKSSKSSTSTAKSKEWKKGDLLRHDTFGIGEVTHVFGSGKKVSIAVKFPSLGQKILDPKRTNIQRVN